MESFTFSQTIEPPLQRNLVLYSGAGWGYQSPGRGWLMDEYLLALTGKTHPNVCLLSVTSGDSEQWLTRLHKCLHDRANLTWAPLFTELPTAEDAVENILDADLIYIPGGYAQGATAAIRAAGWDVHLREAWDNGTVLAGMCAGAMMLCQSYSNRWQNKPGMGEGLAFQPISFTAHAQKPLYEPVLSLFRHGIASGLMPSGYALEDGLALHFRDGNLVDVINSGSRDAKVYLIEQEMGQGIMDDSVKITPLDSDSLDERMRLTQPNIPDEQLTSTPNAQAKTLGRRERRRRLLTPLSEK